MRVFISQPMVQGTTTVQVWVDRAAVVSRLEIAGHTVVDSLIADAPPETSHRALWYLGGALQILAGCDAIYMMAGWSQSRRCTLEYDAAVADGVETMGADE